MQIQTGPPVDVPATSLAAVFFDTVKRAGSRPGFLLRKPEHAGQFDKLPWSEVGTRAREIANGLLSLGIQHGDRVAILSETCGDWSLADYGILSIGGVTVTVYPTLTGDQIAYLLNDSGSKAVFVENQTQMDKVAAVAKDARTVQHWLTFEKVTPPEELAKRTQTLAELRDAGRTYAAANASVLDARLAAVKPEDMATIVYTSGTTGVPKGAVLTHRNFISAYKAANKVLQLERHPNQSTVLFLPLAHCYGRLVVFLFTDLRGSIAFSSPRSLGEDLKAVRPTLVASVPRLYERMYDQIQKKVSEGPDNKKKIFRIAEQTAKEYGKAMSNGGSPGLGLRLRHAVFDRLVYSKLREALGFTELKIGFTGAAAIRPDLLYFFQGIGVNLLEGYGLTETSAPSNVNPPDRFKPGTVGPPFPGMRQALAEDGEVLMQGPNIFQGYYNLPKENEEAFAVIDGESWFRTGDLGQFDEDGFLRIIDRKKELEVLDTGKKIAPITVEEKLKGSPFIGEALLVATGRKFAGCLLQPNFDRLVQWADENRIPYDKSKVVVAPDPTGNPMTYAVGRDLLDHAEVQKLYQGEVDKVNPHCADFERVKAFRLADHAFTMARDELTPTLKKKRRVIVANHKDLIEGMFASR